MFPVSSSPHLFCFGLGYTASALSGDLHAQGWRVSGTCRPGEEGRAKKENVEGVDLHVFAPDHSFDRSCLEGVTHILCSIPPLGDGADLVLSEYGEAIAGLSSLQWLGYLGTTGVYGDACGGWVDEDTPLDPSGARGKARLAVENAWLALWRERGVPVHLFRLAGIYGPGRNALESVRAKKAHRIVKPGQVFSRIHVEDIVSVLKASMEKPYPGRAYNVCDDFPAPPQDVVLYACELLGLTPPGEVPFEEATLSEMAKSFYEFANRIISSDY